MTRNSHNHHFFCWWTRLALFLAAIIVYLLQVDQNVCAFNRVTEGGPSKISDLAIVNDPSGTTLYIADKSLGAIYSYTLPSDAEKRISLDRFQTFHVSTRFTHPSSLAYREGKLLVTDKEANALYELDLRAKTETVLIQANDVADFLEPVSIAVSQGGWVAVGKRTGTKINFYHDNPLKPFANLSSRTIENPSRLFFIDLDLYLFDAEKQILSKIPKFNSVSSAQTINPPSEIARLSDVEDVTFSDGIFYLLEEDGVFALPLPDHDLLDISTESDQKRIPLFSQRDGEFSRVAVSEDYLFIGDNKNRVIWLADLPSRISQLKLGTSHLVWLDKLTKTIYRSDRPPQSIQPSVVGFQRVLEVQNAEKLRSGKPLKEPNGISLDAVGTVYVVDSKAASIFAAKPGGELIEIYAGAPLIEPTDVAAANGVLYVIDSEARKLFSFDLTGRKIVEEYSYQDKTLLPDRVVYYGNSLLALDTRQKILDRFITPEKPAIESPTRSESWVQLEDPAARTLHRGERSQLGKLLHTISDFSVSNNILYFIDADQKLMVLLPILSGAPSFVSYKGVADNPNVIAVDEDDLYLADGIRRRLSKSQIILPVSINFEGEWTSEFLVMFYNYLFERNLLTTRIHKVETTTSLKRLSSELDVLPTRYVDSFLKFFCRLNNELCKDGGKKELLALTLREGQTVVLPNVKMATYSARRGVRLPLDLNLYPPSIFGKYVNGPLGALSLEFAPDGTKLDELSKAISNLNPEYTGSNILEERNGFYIIPVQAVTVHAVVPKIDLLDKESELNVIMKQKNITAFLPTIQSSPQSRVSPRSKSGVNWPIMEPPSDDRCRPVEDNVKSNAMRLVRYCLPTVLPFGTVVHVAVIDNRFNDKHPVFTDPRPADPPTLEIYVGEGSSPDREAISDLGDSSPTASTEPDHRTDYNDIDHGTHVAALIGARQQEKEMVGFMPQSKLYGVGSGESLSKVMDKWEFLRLFNISLGEDIGSSPTGHGGLFIQTAPLIKFIRQYPFSLFIVAAGNSDQRIQDNTLASLGFLDNVLVVGATNSPTVVSDNGILPPMTLLEKPGVESNYHETLVGLVAPGEDIKSALYNGKFGTTDGTSQATAVVTGAAAILMAVKDDWRIWQYKARLVASADLWPGKPPDRKIFAGNLNIQRAVLDTGLAVMDHDPNGICKGKIDQSYLRRKLRIRRPNGASSLEIPWKNILRLERSKENDDLYTLIYYGHHRLENGAGRKNFEMFREQIHVTDLLDNFIFRFNLEVPSPNCASGNVNFKNLKYFLNTFYPSPDDEN